MEQACLDSACPPARALEQAHGLHSPSMLAVRSSTKDQLHIHSARRLRFTIQGLAALLMPGCGVTIEVVYDPQKMVQWLVGFRQYAHEGNDEVMIERSEAHSYRRTYEQLSE